MSESRSSLAEFTLPVLRARSLVRRLAAPAAMAAAAVTAALMMGGRVPAVAAALRRALGVNAAWVAVGIGCEALSLVGYVALLAFVAGGATPRVGRRESAQITLAGAAATRLLPTAGAGGAALTLWALRRSGLSARLAARTLLAFLVVLYAVFLTAIVLAGAVLTLGLVHSPGPLALSAIPAGAAMAAISAALVFGASRRSAGQRVARAPILRRVADAQRLIGQGVRDARRLVASGDHRLLGAIAYWAFDAAVLWAMLRAFGAPPVAPVLALAYFVGQVANTLPLPGSVSGGIAGVLIAFGVPAEVALPAVLTYRTVAVWLPTPIAVAALPRLRATVARWEREDGHSLTAGCVRAGGCTDTRAVEPCAPARPPAVGLAA